MNSVSDVILVMTLTRTATLSSEPSNLDSIYVSWKETTITTEQIISKAITISPTTLRETSTLRMVIPTTTVLPSTDPEPRQSHFTVSSISSDVTSTATDLSSNLPFDDLPSSNSTQVGFAVGIPIAIFALFFIALAVWYFLQLLKSKRELKQDGLVNFSDRLNFSNQELSSPSWETLTERPYPVVFSPTNYFKTDKEFNIYEQQKPKNATKFKSQLNDRLSRLWPLGEKEQDSLAQPHPSFLKRMSVMTPVFLKKFNIGNASLETKETIGSQVFDTPTSKKTNHVPAQQNSNFDFSNVDKRRAMFDHDLHTVIKPYTKGLDDELTIRSGDKCVVLEKFSDEWCKIQLRRKNGHELSEADWKIGLVPRKCLERI